MNPWLFLGLCLVALTAVLGLVFLWYQPSAQGLYPAAARAAIKTKQIHAVVDVRSDEEWRSGHYDGAFHIPIKQLVSRLPHVISDRSTTVLFYCRTGRRAGAAAAAAQELGYRTVYYLEGGDYADLEPRSPTSGGAWY